MIGQNVIALLGRPDSPTDAVEEYCRYLGEGLRAQGFELKIERLAWNERGWASSLRRLRRHARFWRNMWVLVQYTALAWSARGFPLRFLRLLRTLRAAGTRIGVVYHDVEPFGGTRVVDRLRRNAQLRVMREALRLSNAAIFTVLPQKLTWIGNQAKNVLFIPVGANLPVSGESSSARRNVSSDGKLSIAVFGVTGGKAGEHEIKNIVEAVRFAGQRLKNLRLIVLGRHAQDAEVELKRSLEGTGIELYVLGVLPGEEVVRKLSLSDVLLFVRGPISTRRSSAIAGIACGLPLVAFAGAETAPPVTEAGLALYSPERKGDLGDVLVRVLKDEHYRTSLAQKSWLAQAEHFSWNAIAARYAEFLRR